MYDKIYKVLELCSVLFILMYFATTIKYTRFNFLLFPQQMIFIVNLLSPNFYIIWFNINFEILIKIFKRIL